MKTSTDAQREKQAEALLKVVGDCPSVQRFLNKYGKLSSRATVLFHLERYFRWLREAKGVSMTPDELIIDNLRSVYESSAVEVSRKRKHTNLLDEFVNKLMVQRGIADGSRATTASCVRQFYERSDSPLFGDFSVSLQTVRPPAPPLDGDDIRAVLKSLPLAQRVPLLLVWQSSCEVNRVLSLTWGEVNGISRNEYPLKLQFYGRKKHRRPYHTYIGRDSIDALKAWREKWRDLQGRDPQPSDLVFMGKRKAPMNMGNLNAVMRETALKLARQGLVNNSDPASWHSHYLRHSFKSEASHAKVRSEISEFWMGHDGGIRFVYDHSSELHEEDFRDEYMKLEPFVSLNQTEAILKGEFEIERMSWIKEIQELKRQVGRLAESSLQAGPRAQES